MQGTHRRYRPAADRRRSYLWYCVLGGGLQGCHQYRATIPGQTWKFTEDPAGRKADREGLSCKELTGDIARRPIADAVIFGTAFSAEDFKVVTNIVREEAAKYGSTTESSLFNESAKRDYDVQGNGYEFRLLQIKFATLNITGDCFLLQKVLDLPAGQLPPEPPIWPTTSTPH
nr:LppA family lipoprotein [Mycobacterium tuberculosis]